MRLNSILKSSGDCLIFSRFSSNIKISEGDAGGPHMQVGNTLPEHNDEYNFFVLKGSNSPISSEGHLSMYASLSIGQRDISGTTYRWANGDVDNLDNKCSWVCVLASGSKYNFEAVGLAYLTIYGFKDVDLM